MKFIINNEMCLERLQQLFQSEGYVAQIVELLPAAPELGLDRDAYLKVDFPECPSLIVWFDIYNDSHLRMRVIVASREERDQLHVEQLNRHALGANQNIEYFGVFNPGGLTGITLEYRLPCGGGILEGTVLQAAKEMFQGGANAREMLQLFRHKK